MPGDHHQSAPARVSPRALIAAALAVFVLGGSPAPARAFTIYMTCQPAGDGTPQAGCTPLPLRWFQRPHLTYRIATTAPEEVPADAIAGLTRRGFDAWTDSFCDLLPRVELAGTVDVTLPTAPTDIRAAPDNVVVFIRDAAVWAQLGNSPSWIAITKISHNSDTGEIVDADILVNDGDYTFTIAERVKSGEVDFLSMFTHEAGHFFGLDHSTDPSATMFATYTVAAADAKDAASLASDDQLGACTLYTNVPVHVDPPPDGGLGCAGAGGDPLGAAGGAVALLALMRWRARWRAPRRRGSRRELM